MDGNVVQEHRVVNGWPCEQFRFDVAFGDHWSRLDSLSGLLKNPGPCFETCRTSQLVTRLHEGRLVSRIVSFLRRGLSASTLQPPRLRAKLASPEYAPGSSNIHPLSIVHWL